MIILLLFHHSIVHSYINLTIEMLQILLNACKAWVIIGGFPYLSNARDSMFKEESHFMPEKVAMRIVVWVQNSIIEPLLCLLNAVRSVISCR